MKISYLRIRNFKSIRDLEINELENALILVGKNNTGKTNVIDAILTATGNLNFWIRRKALILLCPLNLRMRICSTIIVLVS